MTKYAKEFYWGLVIACLICFSPSKMVAYGSPFLFLFYLLVKNVEVRRTLILLYAVLGVTVVSYFFYYSIYGNTVFQNYLLSILTYSSFLPLLVVDNRKIAQPHLMRRVFGFLSILFLIEGGWGITQALYSAIIVGRGFDVANGDHVEGTIHPGLDAELAFSNPMFAANMSFIGLALLIQYFIYGEGKKIYLFIGFLSIVMASVMHILFLGFASAFFFYLLLRPEFVVVERIRQTLRARFRRTSLKIFLATFTIFLIVAPVYFLTTNITLVESFATKTFLGSTPKAKITVDAFTRIPDDYPLFPLFGFGPGQFTSRASLIGSGTFLGGVDNPQSPPLMQNKMNPVADKIVTPYLYESQRKKYLGSTGFPHYSWLSVYGELGLFGFFGVVGFIVYLVIKAMERARKSDSHRLVAFIFCSGLGLLFLLGIQVNYWEVPQAIFIGVLLLKMIYANLMHLDRFSDQTVVLYPEEEVRALESKRA